MNSNLETASQGELALTDWLRLAGLLIIVVFICFSILLFCKGANHLPANETQGLVHSAAPVAGLELRPESNREAQSQSLLALAAPEAYSGSIKSLSDASTVPIPQPLHRSTFKGPIIFNAKRTPPIRRHRTSSATRLASRQGSPLDKVVLKSVNVLVGMWRHAWEASKVRGRRVAGRSNPSS
jgi:hypothetical protein